jgi:hypothetical protein
LDVMGHYYSGRGDGGVWQVGRGAGRMFAPSSRVRRSPSSRCWRTSKPNDHFGCGSVPKVDPFQRQNLTPVSGQSLQHSRATMGGSVRRRSGINRRADSQSGGSGHRWPRRHAARVSRDEHFAWAPEPQSPVALSPTSASARGLYPSRQVGAGDNPSGRSRRLPCGGPH